MASLYCGTANASLSGSRWTNTPGPHRFTAPATISRSSITCRSSLSGDGIGREIPQTIEADSVTSAVEGGSWVERRSVDRSERLMEDPYEPVEAAMTSPVVTTTPDATVGEVLSHFAHFTGLPVVDSTGRCVGMLSNIDIARHQRRSSNSVASAKVSEVMTSPAFAILRHAPIAYAAGLMLKHKIHRLPVVDSSNMVVGILTRTDIYEPLMPVVNPVLHRVAGLHVGEEETSNY